MWSSWGRVSAAAAARPPPPQQAPQRCQCLHYCCCCCCCCCCCRRRRHCSCPEPKPDPPAAGLPELRGACSAAELQVIARLASGARRCRSEAKRGATAYPPGLQPRRLPAPTTLTAVLRAQQAGRGRLRMPSSFPSFLSSALHLSNHRKPVDTGSATPAATSRGGSYFLRASRGSSSSTRATHPLLPSNQPQMPLLPPSNTVPVLPSLVPCCS